MAEEAPKTVGTGPALGKDFGEHVMDVGKKEEVLALARFPCMPTIPSGGGRRPLRQESHVHYTSPPKLKQLTTITSSEYLVVRLPCK